MTSFITYLSVKADQVALFIGRLILRLAVLILATVALLAMAHALGTDQHATSTGAPAPADTPTSQECAPVAGDLFNPCATIDPSTVDYLYSDPESLCIADGGVRTPLGECTPAALLWRGEVEDGIWAQLQAQGYTWSVDETQAGREALLVPLSILVLDKDDVVAVRL